MTYYQPKERGYAVKFRELNSNILAEVEQKLFELLVSACFASICSV